jgi:hypothetical protein
MIFIEVKSLAGVNFIRASDIMAVQFSDREKCNVILPGGITLPCVEAASAVAERVTAALQGKPIEPSTSAATSAAPRETANGDASD